MVDSESVKPYHELVTDCQSLLYTYISALMSGNQNAGDVLQETNLVLWKKAEEYDPESSFASWAYSIAHFQVLAYFRRNKRDNKVVFNEELVSALACDFQHRDRNLNHRLNILQVCMTRLTRPHRELIRMRYEQGKNNTEIAHHLNKKANTITVTLSRIRGLLMECVERTLGSEGAS